MLGLFNTVNIDGALDRFFLKKGSVAKFPDQPDLTDQVRASLDVLSKNEKGFVLMVESGRIDKYSPLARLGARRLRHDHARQRREGRQGLRGGPQRHADHRRRRPCASASQSSAPTTTTGRGPLRSRLGTYKHSQFPNYPPANADGYPDKVDVSRRLAFVFSAYPDTATTAAPISTARTCPQSRARPRARTWRTRRTAALPARCAAVGNLPFDTNRRCPRGR